MTDWASYLVDAGISLSAGVAALVVLSRLDRIILVSELARRFRFTLWVLVVLMIVRVVHWATNGWISGTLAFWAAALLPLAALLLAESLLRRHAPPPLKWWVAVGVVVLLLAGPVPWGEAVRIGALLCFQLVTLIWVAVFVLSRDRNSLSQGENLGIDRMAWSFVLILPFLATDYLREDAGNIPARMGGIAVLALCWLAISLNRPGLSGRHIAIGFTTVLAVVLCATLVIGQVGSLDLRAGLQTGALLTAAILLLAVWQSAMALTIEDRQSLALSELAQADDPAGLVQRGSGSPDALVIEEDDLEDFDIAVLKSLFSANPVQARRPALPEQLDWLFVRFEATHLVCLGQDPLRIVALANPAMSGSDADDLELRALQRMAALIGERT